MKFNKDNVRKLTQPGIGDVHVDKVLSNISVAYIQKNFIQDGIAPVVKVDKASDKYYLYGRENMRIPETKRAAQADYKRVGFTLSNDTYYCEDYGLEYPIDDKIAKDSDLDLQAGATVFLTQMLAASREKRLADLLGTTGNYASTNRTTLTGADQWEEYETSDPLDDIDTAIAAITVADANSIAFGYTAWRRFQRHPKVLQELRARTDRLPGRATPQDVIDMFEGIENVYVGKAVYISSKEGQTEARSRIWGGDVIVFNRPVAAAQMTPAFVYSFYDTPNTVTTFREKEIRTVVQVHNSFDEKVVSDLMGYLIKNAAGE